MVSRTKKWIVAFAFDSSGLVDGRILIANVSQQNSSIIPTKGTQRGNINRNNNNTPHYQHGLTCAGHSPTPRLPTRVYVDKHTTTAVPAAAGVAQ